MIGTVEELAPLVLDRILNELPVDGRATGLILQNSLTAMGRRFFPLAPMLRILRVSLMSPNWKESDLARALAYSVVEMYMDEVEGHIL